MIIEKTIEINAPDWAFWSALSSVAFKAERGGYYECDWVANSNINWIANDRTQHFYGKLLQVKEMQYLSYLKFDDKKRNQVVALVSYRVRKYGENVVVNLSTDLIKYCDKTEVNVQTKWLHAHIIKLNILAQKIKLKNMRKYRLA